MELLGDVVHVESCFGPFGDTVSVLARYVHGLRQTYHGLRNHFGRTRCYSKVTRLKWMLVLVCLEIVLILTQDRGKFAPNVPWARKLFWTHRMELLGDVGHVECHSVRLEMVLVLVQDR